MPIVTFRADDALVAELHREAKRTGSTVSDVIRRAVEQLAAQPEPEPEPPKRSRVERRWGRIEVL
jgi:hypothetical protein